MWVAHYLLELWEPHSSAESIKASESDASERGFEVWFYLEDPLGRLVEDSALLLPSTLDRTFSDAGGTGRSMAVRFLPNDKGRLRAIGFGIAEQSPKAAFLYCFDNVSPMLSYWTFSFGNGFSIYCVRILDHKHHAEWSILPHHIATESFRLPIDLAPRPEHAAVISLYREGRNAQSPFYRFLCFYKILEAWYRHRSIFGEADRLIKDNAERIMQHGDTVPSRPPQRRITKDML